MPSSSDAPSARGGSSLTWSPSTTEFIVWGGYQYDGTYLADGARYAVSGSWKPMSVTNAPSARARHFAVMLGAKLVVWGGQDDGALHTATGGMYDITTDQWETLPLDECAPGPRSGATFTAFGDGKHVLLWGGEPQPPSADAPVEQGWILTP